MFFFNEKYLTFKKIYLNSIKTSVFNEKYLVFKKIYLY